MPSEPKIAPNSPIWFFEEFRGFFPTNLANFFAKWLVSTQWTTLGWWEVSFLKSPFYHNPLDLRRFWGWGLGTHIWEKSPLKKGVFFTPFLTHLGKPCTSKADEFFEKFQTVFDPPSFSENHIANFSEIHDRSIVYNGKNLQYKFLDWKWHPTPISGKMKNHRFW